MARNAADQPTGHAALAHPEGPVVEIDRLAGLLRDSLESAQMPFIRLTSDSMAPLLRRGDEVGLERTGAEELQPGDIVVVRGPLKLLTHRFWHHMGDGLATRGDRSLSFDPHWTRDALVGRVVMRRRADRSLSLQGGAGKFASRHLFWLACKESALLGTTVEWKDAGPDPIPEKRAPQAMFSIIRRAIRAWAGIVAGVAGLAFTRRRQS